MKVVLVCLALIAVIGIFLAKRQNPAKKKLNPSRKMLARAKSAAPPPSPYRATSITHGSDACNAVKSLDEHRFLLDDAPLVPLPDCDSLKCNCKYIRHKDRRDEEAERRAISGLSGDLYSNAGNQERRGEVRKFGRRESDTEY